MIGEESVRLLIQHGEGQETEFKKSFASVEKAIETLCAFSNSEGGVVIFGVRDSGEVSGVELGGNTLENFANKLRSQTQPPLSPVIEKIYLDTKTLVTASVLKSQPGELFYAFNRPFIRVGNTNQTMTPMEQKSRLSSGLQPSGSVNTIPRFEIKNDGFDGLESAFRPGWKITQESGEFVPDLEWRIRGPRFSMNWSWISGSGLSKQRLAETLDLRRETRPDELIEDNEIGVEIRFQLAGRWHHELHKFPITNSIHAKGSMWDVGRKVSQPLRFLSD